MQTLLDAEEMAELLRSAGFHVVEDLSAPEIRARYLAQGRMGLTFRTSRGYAAPNAPADTHRNRGPCTSRVALPAASCEAGRKRHTYHGTISQAAARRG